MVISTCQHSQTKKHGRDRNGNQRLRCMVCGKTFAEPVVRPLGDMRTSVKDAATALGLLLEGMSVRAVERLTGLKRDTICELILVVGANCRRLLNEKVHDVAVADVQCDELWSFVGCKERTRVARRHTGDEGSCWTFIAIERNTKLVLAHTVGQRDNQTCWEFVGQLSAATAGRFQLSTDGLGAYTLNVPFMFQGRVDFGQLVKNYAGTQSVSRYSPAKIIGAEKRPRSGNPDPDRICTSHIERLNLTLRMNLRRFTRLTNAHSKSMRHHKAMQAIFFAWYNFARKHDAIKQTPAQAAGLADKQWTIRELIELSAAV